MSNKETRVPGVFCSKIKAQAVSAVLQAATHESHMPLSFSQGMQSMPSPWRMQVQGGHEAHRTGN